MDVLVVARTVHGCAAACDYLDDRDDVEAVTGVGIAPSDDDRAHRDAGKAMNVLGVRRPGADTEQREGDPATVVPAAVADHGADEVVVPAGLGGLDDWLAAPGVTTVVVPAPDDGG